MKELLLIAVGSAFVNNVVLSQFLGICPFLGVSKNVKTAGGMGGAVIFVISIASLVTSIIYKFILVPTHVEYLQTIVFILVIAALVQFVEMFLKKSMPPLYNALGVYLPLITTNCAVLGVALTNVQHLGRADLRDRNGCRLYGGDRTDGRHPGEDRIQRHHGIIPGNAHCAGNCRSDGDRVLRIFRTDLRREE